MNSLTIGNVQSQIDELEQERMINKEQYSTNIQTIDENLQRLNDNTIVLMERKRKLEEQIKNVNLALSKITDDKDVLLKEKEVRQNTVCFFKKMVTNM